MTALSFLEAVFPRSTSPACYNTIIMYSFLVKHKKAISILAPTALGVLYILLCALNLQQSIWFDESYGAYLTRFGFWDIWNLTAVDVHPPLYYFLLKIWSNVFGYTDFAMRFMSVFFGAIAISFAWAWLKRKYGFKVALVAGIFMALSPMLIRYGQEMRMYTMAAAIIFAATFFLQLALDTNKLRFWLTYGILMSLGMWTHYFTALIWLAQLAYLIYYFRKKIFQRNIISAYILAVALYLPWSPFLFKQIGTVQRGFWIADPTLNSLASFVTETLFYAESDTIKGWFIVLALVALASAIFVVLKAKKQFQLLSFMVVLPPIILLLCSLPPLTPMFIDRYLINSSVCLSILIGASAASLIFYKTKKQTSAHPSRLFKNPQFLGVLALVVLLIGSGFGIYNVYSMGNYNKATDSKSDAKALFQAVAEVANDEEAIIASSEWLYYDLSFYGNAEHPVYFVEELTSYQYGSHEPLRLNDYGKIVNLDSFLENQDCVWYVGDLPSEGDLEFPREAWSQRDNLVLSVNINQAAYQAIEFCKE